MAVLAIGQGNLQGILLAILGVADEGTVDADAPAVTLGKTSPVVVLSN